MAGYPSTLPTPSIEGYQSQVDYGYSGVTFENGNRRQRKRYRQEIYQFSFSLILTSEQLWTWQSWANDFGYSWHWMKMQSNYVGAGGATVLLHYIRYTSDISIEALDGPYFRVTVQAEMDINTLPQGVAVNTGNWIRAGTPASPSNSNTYIAGTPASPSNSNTVISGTPSYPAA